jgi:hypothetical protein
MTTANQPNWQISEVPLICGHSVLYKISPAKKGDIVFCIKCDSYSTVIASNIRYRVNSGEAS